MDSVSSEVLPYMGAYHMAGMLVFIDELTRIVYVYYMVFVTNVHLRRIEL